MVKGEIKNRESFLDNVANHLGRNRKTANVMRPKWSNQVQWNVLNGYTKEELVDVLEKQCESIHTSFRRTDQHHLNQTILDVIHDFGGKSIITWDDPRFTTFGFEEQYRSWSNDYGIHVAQWDDQKSDESKTIAEQADIGITFSDYTLAESGTVVLFSDRGKGRSVSLLPATYIAIIPKSTIVPRMSQVTREIHQRVEAGEKVASCVNFISGPSNSADIEMNLVVGVHGPIKATYIVVEDR